MTNPTAPSSVHYNGCPTRAYQFGEAASCEAVPKRKGRFSLVPCVKQA